MNRRKTQSTIGTTVAVLGFLMVVFALDFTIPGFDVRAWDGLQVQGFIGLVLLIVGTVIVATKR